MTKRISHGGVVVVFVFVFVVVVVVVVVVVWFIMIKEKLLLEVLTLSEFVRGFSSVKVCFVSRPMKIVPFPRTNGETPKWIVDFPQ